MLKFWSFSEVVGTDEIEASAQEIVDVVAFIEILRERLRSERPLVPEVTKDIPEDYPNEEHARMLEAVAAVLRAALEANQPFRAWVE